MPGARPQPCAAPADRAEPSADPFADLYRAETPWLLRFFRRRLGNADEAQDLAQEAMLRYLRVAPEASIATPQAYLRRIATNLLRDRSEHSSTRLAAQSVPMIEGLDQSDDFDQHRQLSGRQELAEWEAILAQLKPRTLEIFLLSRVDGFTYGEIASRTGMTIWGVKKHMTRAIGHIERHRSAR